VPGRRGPGARHPEHERKIGKAAGVESLVELLGAILILSAFVLAQLGRLRTASPTYVFLNLAGSAILAFVAAFDRDLGFLVLEGVWALVSAYAAVGLLIHR
jgi:hypothetical protein